MYCPLLCINQPGTASFGQCMKEACAWWITADGTGKCAVAQIRA